MVNASYLLETEFHCGITTVRIIEGDILAPGVDVDAIVSSDDNHLSMAAGLARQLADVAGPDYRHEVQAQSPVRAGTVVITQPYGLTKRVLNVQCVLHATVIDFDTYDVPLEQTVYETTINCLVEADRRGLASMVFPALAAGAGGLDIEQCARQMCTAIKTFLTRKHSLNAIYLILHHPGADETPDPTKLERCKDRNQRFIKTANLVLGIPHSPLENERHARDFGGRESIIQHIEDVILGKVEGKHHVLLRGGPQVGKTTLLEQLFYRAYHPEPRRPGSALGPGRRVARVTFARLHEHTPARFIYRKLLLSLLEVEDDPRVKAELRQASANPEMSTAGFLEFLKRHSDRYSQILFLVDQLPWILRRAAQEPDGSPAIWPRLDMLDQAGLRFIVASREEKDHDAVMSRISDSFKAGLEEIWLKCVEDRERREWIDELYQRYLRRPATGDEHEFFEREAGRHPYLIGLASHALIKELKYDAITNPMHHPTEYNQQTLAPFFRAAHRAMDEPRRAFFDVLLGPALDARDRDLLKFLAKAVAIEEAQRSLIPALESNDPDAVARWQRLDREWNPRRMLDGQRLRRLEAHGYLVDADSPETAQFMAPSFARYVAGFFGVNLNGDDDRPKDVVISLLSPEPQVVNTLFYTNSGVISITAQKRLLSEVKAEFMESFGNYINYQLHPGRYPPPEVFQSLEEVGHFILTQFTTGAIKSYLQNPLHGSTIKLMVHEDLKDIPWELMLEAAYTGEIPFRVGRSIISARSPGRMASPLRRPGKIKALLIGDPTDDLAEARNEVQNLADRLRRDDCFADPDVFIGAQTCRRMRLLTALESGGYGLIHYSGHTRFEGQHSAWQLTDGKSIATDMLTSALQMAPPALVFSSSCESAVGGEPQPIKYEDQAFDLPGAFVQAGVEAYIGTLWEVEALAARQFVEEFYDAFLSGEHNLGECVRRAKWALKRRRDRINWLAFILYGDPHIEPGDLFPALRH